jgi:hypothetical protein
VAANRGSGDNKGSGRRGHRGRECIFFYKFISYVASYVVPIQTGFLMAFLARFRRKSNRDSCSKQATGIEKTGIRRILAGIGNLACRNPMECTIKQRSS